MNNRQQNSRSPRNNGRYSNNAKNGKRNPSRRPGGSNGNFNGANASSARSKYIEKAREALSEGDRVAAENFFQHADHYNRILEESGERRANDNLENNGHRSRSEEAETGFNEYDSEDADFSKTAENSSPEVENIAQ